MTGDINQRTVNGGKYVFFVVVDVEIRTESFLD